MTELATIDASAQLRHVLERGGLRAAFQPIVELATGAVSGYESLARGPLGTALESPAALFAAATDIQLLSQLDRACRQAAIEGAARYLDPRLPLFINVEPRTLAAGIDDDDPLLSAAGPHQIVVEVTERMLFARPAELLAFIADARRRGLGIALDDVGSIDESLALMPFIRPDVIKLDMRLVQDRPTADHGRVTAAVLAQAEATGAHILAEGIETEEHVERARGMGATLGQGWHYGRPDAAPDRIASSAPAALPLVPTITQSKGTTPFDVVSTTRPVRTARRSQLLALSEHLESIPSATSRPDVVVSAFQDHTRFTAHTARRYERLAQHCTLVAALGVAMHDEPAAGVRGVALDPEDPLRSEWSVIVVGPHYAAALVAQELPDPDRSSDPLFNFAITHERTLVVAAAATLISRITPQ